MNVLLDKKIEKKLKALEEVDKLNSLYYQKKSNIKNKDKDNTDKIQNLKKNNKNKFEDIYSNFDFKNNSNNFYFQNYKDLGEILSDAPKNPKEQKEQKPKNIRPINKHNSDKKLKPVVKFEFEEVIPKNATVMDRLMKYGTNIKLKKEKMNKINEINMRKKSIPEISKMAKNINRDPNKFEERLYYNPNKRLINDKKKKKSSYKNDNFTYHPSIDKNSKKIADRLGPASKRLLLKKKVQKEEIEKQATDAYKNIKNSHSLFLDNNYIHIRPKNKHIKNSTKKTMCQLYQRGMESIKKKELKYKNNILIKSQEYKKYTYQPTFFSSDRGKHNKKTTDINNEKKPNDEIYKRQMEWKTKTSLENYKKRQAEIEFYLNYTCPFQPNTICNYVKDDDKLIKSNLKGMKSYVSRRRKQLQENENKSKLNKSYNSKKEYGFTTKDLYYKPNQNFNSSKKKSKRNSPFVNLNKVNNKRNIAQNMQKYNFDCIIPPSSKRIFFYYNDSGELSNSVQKNKFNSVNYSNSNFIDAVNCLHGEIENLNISFS